MAAEAHEKEHPHIAQGDLAEAVEAYTAGAIARRRSIAVLVRIARRLA